MRGTASLHGGDAPGAREEVSVAIDKGGGKKRRSYRPAVEALEALRLLSNAAQTLPDIVVPHDLLAPTSLLDAPVPSPPRAPRGIRPSTRRGWSNCWPAEQRGRFRTNSSGRRN